MLSVELYVPLLQHGLIHSVSTAIIVHQVRVQSLS